ncbi:hypothetical protein MMC12_005552 [Toensbergia leucococca]|nr:hypothetical protein [Toensbergia leucococca]
MIIDTARHPLIAQITPGPKAPSRALLEGRAIDTCGFIHVRLEPTTGAGLAAQSIQGQDGTVGSGAIGSSAAATTSSAPTTDTTSSSTTTQQAITSESNISSSSFETISSTTIATSQSSSNSLSSVTSVSSTTAATTSQDSNGSSSFTTISSSATPTTSESSGGSDSGGLSNSDKIVLATSLPGLALTALIAGLTYVLVKRSKEKKKQKDPVKKNKTPPKTI